MEEWKEYRLGDLCYKVCSGGTPKSTCSAYYDSGTIPWLNTKEINFNRIYETESHITKEGLNNSSAKWIDANSVIVAMYGATAGRVAVAKVPMTTNQACCNLMIDDSKAEYDFIYYYLSNSYKHLLMMANGAAQQNLNAQILKDFIISLPSLPTQRRIASILSSLDDKIECNRKICANLEAQAQALFKHWFVDFAPFKNGKFVESELGMIPEGWRVGTLGEIISTNKRSYKGDFANTIHYLDTGSITNNVIDTIQVLDPKVDKIPSRAKRAVTEGDIVFSSVRPNQKHYGFLFNPIPELVVSTGFIVITANWSGYRYFVYRYLTQDSVIKKLQAIAEQSVSTFPSINATDVEKLKVVIPPNDIVGEFATINCKMMFQIDVLQQESSRLASLRDTLLPKLMSGEIKV